MGKYSGKLLTVYITPTGVRVCEGENKNGNPDVSKFFLVGGVSEYFGPSMDGRTPEIVNMSGLVAAIVDECKAHNVSTRRVMVCSNCFGISTEVSMAAGGGALKGALTGDVKNLFSFGKKEDKGPALPDKMVCKQKWGELTRDGTVNNVSTVTLGDKYLLSSLVKEFYVKGYEVVYVSGCQEALLNLRITEAATFDSRGKIIFDYDVACSMDVLLQDIPVDIASISMVDRDEVLGRLRSQLNSAQTKTGRNPKVYLTGSIFSDTQLYCQVMDALEADGYFVYDLFGRPELPDDYAEKVRVGEMAPVMTPDYTVNIAMLLSGFAKTCITLTPQVDLEDVFKKNSKAIATIGCGVSVAMFAVAALLGGLRLYDLHQIKTNPSSLSTLQNQVTTLTSKQTSLNSTIATLTEADTTVLELMKFIDTNQSDRVHVVSVDTRDMLSDELSVDSSGVTVAPVTPTPAPTAAGTTPAAGTAPVDTTVSGSTGGSASDRAPIVIRGYAKTGNEAVGYFNKLFNYGLPMDPVLNGVERYTLPAGEEVYVFEIEIGGDDL